MRQICQYIYLLWTQSNQQCEWISGIHTFTLWAYSPEQIFLPHCTCMSQCTNNVVYLQTTNCCSQEPKKTINCNFIYHVIPIYMPPKICSSNAKYIPHMQITSFADMRQLCQYTYLIWSHCNQQCDQKHRYTYISHYLHMLLTNMSPILHTYVTLQF